MKWIKRLFKSSAGETGMEAIMADTESKPVNPAPQNQGGIDLESLGKTLATAVAAAVAEGIKPLADAIAKGTGGKVKEPEAPKYLTAEDLARALEERDRAREVAARRTAIRQKFADELRTKKVPDELITVHLPDTEDEAKLKAASDAIVTRWNELGKVSQPDLGGASKEGGAAAGKGESPPKIIGDLSPALSRFAAAAALQIEKANQGAKQ